MLSKVFDQLASLSDNHQVLLDEVNEYQVVKSEINKARCVIEFDADGVITSFNENAEAATGFKADEIIGQHHRTLIGRSEADKSEYQEFWRHLRAGDTPNTGYYQLKGKSGQDLWMQGYYAPVLQKGELRKVIAYLTDVTADQDSAHVMASEGNALNETFGLMECDLSANILNCNELFASPLGYTPEELIGKDTSKLIKPELLNSPEYQEMWNRLRTGESVKNETCRLSKTGEEFWFSSTYVPIKNDKGDIMKIKVYSYCITEDKLKVADYKGQLDAISKIQGVIEFDLKGNILAVNDNFVAVTGYERDQIVGQHHSMFVSSELKTSSEYKAFWDRLGRGEAENGLYQRFGKGGKEIWLQASYNPIYDLNGKPFKVVKYATDVTEFKLKEANNSGQVEALNKVLGVIEFDLKGNITKVNENFTKVVGYTESEIVGNHHSMFASDALKNSPEYKQFWLDLGEGKAKSGQFQRFGKGGKEIWLEATYNPIFDMNGNPFKVVKFATDISEQHETSEMLKAAVEESQGVIQQAQAGNLTTRIPMDGKTGAIGSLCDGINALMDKMTEVLMTIREAGETINTAADEISTGNNDLSQRTEQQASNLEETASSMEELASTVKQNAENAKQANQLASAASGVAVKGGEVVGEVVTTMSAINESAQKIEDIITVIDGIAFQTNILALNAAVEAARAGEQGRGFAVVAGEVRNLAQRSASAAKEIKELITDSVTKTSEGTALVENAGATMQEIVDSVQRVTDIMGEISAASNEQSAGIDQVNGAITNMDEVTQQNAALVEEAAAAAESLVDQAVSLMDTVNEFQLQGGQAKQDRRAPNSPMRGGASKPTAAKPETKPVTAKPVAKTGTDDNDWEEF